MPLIDTSQIPGYAEAVARQDLVRDAAFLGVPETLCGITVAPMTFRHLLWLQIVRSPFIGASPPNSAMLHLDVATFFKTVAPFSPPSFMAKPPAAALRAFMAKVGRLKAPEALDGIRDFVNEAFMDAPGGGESSNVSYFSIGAALTHRLCEHYSGLDPNPMNYPSAADMPLKAGFQLLKCLKKSERPDAIMFNGLSDQIKTRWINAQNPSPSHN